MKKCRLITLFVLFSLYLLPARAEKVPVEKAEKVAENYILSRGTVTKSTLNLTLVHTEFSSATEGMNTKSSTSDATFYIFSKGNGNGFIIVSADDVAVPVLG